jgi:hypothetical protein|tara:strand:+ start:124 stop:537 length:414 start_codon:yes stop_codon:yes gene_type:complete
MIDFTKMTQKEIDEFIMEGIRGANELAEKREKGLLPPYDRNHPMAQYLRGLAENAKLKREEELNRQSVMSANNNVANTGKNPSALGFQARAAMYNAGNDSGRPYRPPMTNGAMGNYDMDLRDQCGIEYNSDAPWEEL